MKDERQFASGEVVFLRGNGLLEGCRWRRGKQPRRGPRRRVTSSPLEGEEAAPPLTRSWQRVPLSSLVEEQAAQQLVGRGGGRDAGPLGNVRSITAAVRPRRRK